MQRLLLPLLTGLLFFPFPLFAQDATLYGTIESENGKGIELATIAIQGTSIGATSRADGSYELQVPAEEKLVVVFTGVGFRVEKKNIQLQKNERRQLNIQLVKSAQTLDEFVKKDDRTRYEAGAIQITTQKANVLPSTIGGIEGLLKTFVGSNNELTSQYNVRGGNYDENLVYVNDFEIYRPFLTRSGQQEGLSFVNADLVSNVSFSIGGFQAKYGDKMSSVLDVTYKRPTSFRGGVMLSLLGAALHLEGSSKNGKLTYLLGLRQKSNQYLLQSQPTKGVYNPSFTDVQGLVSYRFNDKWEAEIIANYARNRFSFYPEHQSTAFGLVNEAYLLDMIYEGSEIDQFDSRFGGVSATFRPDRKTKLKLLASGFETNERETYDISGEYLFGQLETDLGKENFGQIKAAKGTGIIHDFARNYLKVKVANLAHRGSVQAANHFISWGVDANFTSIEDRLHEWERRDSAGFTQPYYEDSIIMKRFYHSSAQFDYTRLTAFVQDNFRFNDSLDLTISAGVRFSYDLLNQEFITSPRLQIAYKPDWKKDIVFKVAAGLYAQPPFYREMRASTGTVNKGLRAQKSFHLVAGADYNFKMYNRPFRLTSEFYYKKLWDLVPYEYDNIRIRYSGRNNAKGYVYGGEIRLFGDLVKDATSWVSIGMMKAMEDISDDQLVLHDRNGADSVTIFPGYVPRPTDQRFMLGMYFEDYLPNNKNFKAHLNLMYATGLPFGPPGKPRYGDVMRLPDYKRVDLGFSALLLDPSRTQRPSHSFFRNLQSIWASIEVFNLLGIQNTLSYTWIQDQTTDKTYAVPNRLTSRLLNVKLIVNF